MTNNKIFKALILGVDDRSALTVMRSLGRKGVEVHQGKDVRHSVCTDSRFVRKVIDFPNAGREPEKWLEKLIETLRQTRYDLVIPTADNYLVLAVKNREKLAPLAKFAIPDDNGFIYTYKKSKTLELARRLGVPCPKTREISRMDEIPSIVAEFKLPVIIKPVSSKVWQKNVRHHLDVELATDRAALEKKLSRLLEICPVLIQSFHPGVGVGQEFLMRDGELVAAFQHERVHEPLGGGGSSYRKSAPLDEDLLNHSLNMLRELRWTGVAMVEYKRNKATGNSVLMEINGRFWGSLPLAVAAGVDFPGLLFDMLVEDKTPENVTYRENLFCRNPGKDLDWLKEDIRADKNDPFNITVPLPKLAAEVINALLFRERLDTITLDDPKPGVKQLSAYIAENFRGARDKLHRLFIRLNYRYNPLARQKANRRLQKMLDKNPTIAFVCKGNICRSPFADIYFRERVNDAQNPRISVDSYGLIERINRQSPDVAIAAAKHFGIDMTAHRSKLLTDDGVLFIMDFELFKRVKSQFPRAEHKLFFLGVLQNDSAAPVEILDPYGSSLKNFQKTFSQITQSIDNLARLTNSVIINNNRSLQTPVKQIKHPQKRGERG